MATQTWTYKFYNLVTHTFLGTLPLTGVSFSQALNTPGSFSGQINIKDTRVQALTPADITQPGRAALYIDLNGVIVWGGVVATRTFSRSSGTISLAGQQTWGYFQQRLLAQDYSTTPTHDFNKSTGPTYWTTTPADPIAVAQQFVLDATNGGNIGGNGSNGTTNGIQFATYGSTPSSNYITPNYPITQPQTVDQVVTQLSQLGYLVGFDFALDAAYNANGVPYLTANFWYPRRGRIAGATGLVINTQSALDYEYPEDSTQCANKIIETGSGSGGVQQIAQDTVPLAQGYPLLERVISKSNVVDPNLLNSMANYDLGLYHYPPATPTVTLPIDYPHCPLGQYITGDDVRWIIDQDERFLAGSDSYWRIVQFDVTVPESGIATQKLTFNPPPVIV